MPLFTYRGGSRRLVIAGQTLHRDVPTEIEDERAIAAATAHPDIYEGDEAPAIAASEPGPAETLESIGLWLEGLANANRAELRQRLGRLDEDALAQLVDEYEVKADGPDAALDALADEMLSFEVESDDEPPAPEPLAGKALDDRAAELEIEGRGSMSADEKREAVAKREAELAAEQGGS